MKQSNQLNSFTKRISKKFLASVERERGKGFVLQTFNDFTGTAPLDPIIVNNCDKLTKNERKAIVESYQIKGSAYIIPLTEPLKEKAHPIFQLAEQLQDDLRLKYPLVHPLEGHHEATKRFGENDYTFKIYDLPSNHTKDSYREVAETSHPFNVHLDGLGSGGTVQTIFLYADSIPLFGGYTFVYDLLKIAVALNNEDPEAFQSLFLPNAITALRPRGKGAIKVSSPIFYIDSFNMPHAFYRQNSGEYRMEWLSNPALLRAKEKLEQYTVPFAPSSRFVSYATNSFLISRNRDMAHGRTGFIDGTESNSKRLLSRKWFMASKEHQKYRHIPGTFVHNDYRKALNEDIFLDKYLHGEWLYDGNKDQNYRIK